MIKWKQLFEHVDVVEIPGHRKVIIIAFEADEETSIISKLETMSGEKQHTHTHTK